MRNKLGYFTIVFLMLTTLGKVHAQESENYVDLDIPTINGHQFIANSFSFGPFTNTSFSSNLGLGTTTDYTLPPIDLGDTTLTIRGGSILFANLGIRYSQRVKDWVSFFLTVGGTGRIGVDPQSLFTQGVNTITGGDIGANFVLATKKKYMLSIDFGLKNYTGSFINVAGFINDYLAGDTTANINQTIPALQFFTGIKAAWGISELFGVSGAVNGLYGDSFIRGNSEFDYIFTVSGEINLYPKTSVPLGISISYINTSHPESSFVQNENAQIFGIKIAYTGSDDFSVGLDLMNMKVPLNLENEKVIVNQTGLNLTYYFN